MSTGRTPKQADKDQRRRDEDNLELRNQRRREHGLEPLTMRDYLARLGRAEGNRQHVRDTLAIRQPQLARTLDRTVRELRPRTGRSR